MEKIFCVHVPVLVSRFEVIKVIQAPNGEWVPDEADARKSAGDILRTVRERFMEGDFEEEIGNDIWIDEERVLSVSDALGDPTDDKELEDCNGPSYEFSLQYGMDK